eukprot:1350563-Amphidinium_carterae.1
MEGVAVQTDGGWAASPGAVASFGKRGTQSVLSSNPPFLAPPDSALGSVWEVLACLKKSKVIGADQWTVKELRSLGPEAIKPWKPYIFHICEQQGHWPDELRKLLYLQLPKKGATQAEA